MAGPQAGCRQHLGFRRAPKWPLSWGRDTSWAVPSSSSLPEPQAQRTSHVPGQKARGTSTAGCWRGHLGDTHQVEKLLQLLVGIVDAELLKAVELKHLKPADRDPTEQGRTTPASQELHVATDPTSLQGQALPHDPAAGHRPMAGAGPRSSTQRGRGAPSLPVDVQDADGGVVALR